MQKKINAIGGIIVLAMVLFFILRGCFQQSDLDRYGRLTVAMTNGQNVFSGGVWVQYSFFVSDVEHKGESRAFDFKPEVDKGKYYVKYLPTNPSVNEIYWDKPVPECVGEPPADGWGEIPTCK